jgi:hypothetical protein
MIPNVEIYIKNPVNFYNKYELTEDELAWLYMMHEEGKGQEATDIFIQQFILPPATKYQDVLISYMGQADSGILEQKETNNLSRNITALTLGLIALLNSNYSKYVKNVYAPQIMKDSGLTDTEVRNSVMNEVVSRFQETVQIALSQTGTFVNNSIKTLQREFIAENFSLRKSELSADAINQIISNFKVSLRKKYPKFYKAIEERNIITTARMTEAGVRFTRFKIDYYLDMVIRDSILNIDRNSVQIMALANSEAVVGYRLMDDRNVKKDREICQEILNNKILGMSLLAVDDLTAKKLGIMSVDEAKATPDFAMGYNCRHGIYRLPQDFLNRIDDLLKEVA